MSLLSDFEGCASVVAVATPGKQPLGEPQARLAEVLGNLPGKLAASCIILWIHAGKETSDAPFEIDGRTVIPVFIAPSDAVPGKVRWLQDPFVCALTQGAPTLVVPVQSNGLSKETVLRLAASLNWLVKPVPLHLEGGNILQLGEYLLLGKDLAYQNGIERVDTYLSPKREPWAALEAQIQSAWGAKQLVWVGTDHEVRLPVVSTARVAPTWQPFFHLDLFLLPGGRSPEGNLRLFLGQLVNVEHLGLTEMHRQAFAQLETALDGLEVLLRAAIPGLEIARLPILTFLQGSQLLVQSLCNGWVEVTPTTKQAFLPDYRPQDLPPAYRLTVDEAHLQAEQSLKAWGFTTRWVEMNFPKLAQDGGALHCAVKVLVRTI
jgi:hypothetical protein